MSYDKGQYAFFDGSSSDYKKVVEPGKTIAGYTVTSVTGNSVTLQSGTNTVDLHVGMQMRRDDAGEWQVFGGSALQAGAPSSSNQPSASSSDSSLAEENDIAKKLMKQREEELK
jgi:hypothetical protein